MSPLLWIERSLAPRLVQLSRQFPALLVTGARQTGKTSLLQRTFSKAAFVSLDLPSAAHQADENAEEFLGGEREPLILDEVQYAPRLFRHLKVAIDKDRHRMGRFLMTGSQKFPLMRSLSESLAGRCAVVELDTLSSHELLTTLGPKTPPASHLMWRGGFPELYRNPGLNARAFYSSYVATYLERDVRSSLRIGSLRDFERFLRACALRSGQLLNLAELARDIGIAGTTARDWISVLEASNQLLLLEPYFSNAGKRMIKTPKLYLRDTGLLCFLLGFDSPAALERSPAVGAIWETFVVGQILRAVSVSGSAAAVYFWRDAQGTEVDFVIEHEGQLRLIEAKWSEEPRDTKALATIDKVRGHLGKRAAPEHWIACRTPRSHQVPGAGWARLVNAVVFKEWVRA